MVEVASTEQTSGTLQNQSVTSDSKKVAPKVAPKFIRCKSFFLRTFRIVLRGTDEGFASKPNGVNGSLRFNRIAI